MASPLILARTFKEAHAYAQDELGLTIGYYRVVNSAGTIKAVRNTDIHLVPGWTKRAGHFAFKSALRYCHLNVIDVEKARESQAAFDAAMPPTAAPTVVGEADDFFDNVTPEAPEPTATCTSCGIDPHDPECPEYDEPKPEPVAEPAEKPKARRRTRCKKCEQLHFKGDPCVDSEAV